MQESNYLSFLQGPIIGLLTRASHANAFLRRRRVGVRTAPGGAKKQIVRLFRRTLSSSAVTAALLLFGEGFSCLNVRHMGGVAAMRVSLVFLDTAETIEKACALVSEAAHHGARLIAVPEAFLPAFPCGALFARQSLITISFGGCGARGKREVETLIAIPRINKEIVKEGGGARLAPTAFRNDMIVRKLLRYRSYDGRVVHSRDESRHRRVFSNGCTSSFT